MSLWSSAALLLAALTFTAGTAQAQVRVPLDQRQRLRTLAEEYRVEEQAEQARTERLAREQGLELMDVQPDGRIVKLDHFDEDGRPVYITSHMDAARATIGADRLQPGGDTGLNLTGEGITLGMWEIGSGRGSHQEFEGRFRQRDGDFGNAGHATHVGGMMISGGVNPRARGMSYRATLDAYDTNGSRSEMPSAAAAGLQVSNHSYGLVGGWAGAGSCIDGKERRRWHGDPDVDEEEDWRFGFYNSKAERWDRIAHNAPHYLIVNSGGNDRGNSGPTEHCVYRNGAWRVVHQDRPPDGGADGFDSVSDAVVAKNVLGVGSVQDIPDGYQQPGDVRTAGYSAWGPADDGRIKPDVVANGTGVFNANANGDDTYASLGGTSMAAPSVSGAIGLLLEHHRNLNGTDAPPMRASTIKGLLIHTADEAGPHPGPDYMHGWGLVNVAEAALLMSEDSRFNNMLLQEHTLAQGGDVQVPLDVVDSTRALRVTISWTDPPASSPQKSLDPRDPMLINDVDLVIEGPDGTLHEPWVLDVENPSAPAARANNVLDNTEQVVVPNPKPGRYVARVTHKNALQDGNQVVSLILDRAPGDRYSVAGRITLADDPSTGGGGVELQLSGFEDRTIRSNPDGMFSFDGLYDGDYTVTPVMDGVTFTPEQQDVTVEGDDITGMDFVATTPGHREITLRLNTATLPDTLGPDDVVQVRGCLAECTGEASTLPDGQMLAWDERSTITMTNVGGDYWEATMQVPEADSVDFKFFAQVEGQEEGYLEVGETHRLEAGIGHRTMPLHFFEASGDDQPYEWQPWERPEESWVAVHYRVLLPDGVFAIVPAVLGDDVGGAGPLRWDQARLKLEAEESPSGTSARFYSATAYYPPELQGREQAYRFALTVQQRVEGAERTFTIPASDTTLYWAPLGNAQPLAADDEVEVDEDSSVVVDVLDNDSDPDGDSLFVASVGDPVRGTTEITADGRISYTPEADYDENDVFTYVLRDAAGFEQEADVSVDVRPINDAPTAPVVMQPGEAATIHVEDGWTPFEVAWYSSSDPDGDRLDYTWQLARTETFEDVVWSDEVRGDTTLAVAAGSFDRMLDSLGVDVGSAITLHHRTSVNDGTVAVQGDTLALTLERGVVTGTETGSEPTRFTTEAPFPNPARSSAALRYALPTPDDVRVEVVDALGRVVQTFAPGRQQAGWHTLHIDANDLPSGVYFCRVQAGSHRAVQSMVVAR